MCACIGLEILAFLNDKAIICRRLNIGHPKTLGSISQSESMFPDTETGSLQVRFQATPVRVS